MTFGRFGRWKWPANDDVEEYSRKDVIKKLNAPPTTGRRATEFSFDDF